MRTKNNNTILELEPLQKIILDTCTYLNRPIRKNSLIKMITQLFEYNSPSQVEFAIIVLLERGALIQYNFFIVTNEFSKDWDKHVTNMDENVIKFLLSLKEECKYDLFFDVFAKENLKPSIFFKYVKDKYPMLLKRENQALALMEQIDNTFFWGISNEFYVEQNDYPTNRPLTRLLDNPDCMFFVQKIEVHRNYAYFHIMLLPNKKGKYQEAKKQVKEFEKIIPSYFDDSRKIYCKCTILALRIGTSKRKHK